jgi:putative phosphoesterase
MKIGLFSDVHGHVNELHKTLALLESHGVDQMLCAGDLVDKGQYSDEVVDVLRSRAIPCVQGNHDAKVQFGYLHHQTLKDSSFVYLTSLPPTLTFQWEDLKIYLCHANPWEDSSIYVYPTRPLSLLQMVARAVDADVMIMGHTHHPMCLTVESKLLINPGSIYGNRDRREQTCGILSLPDCTFTLYDIDTGRQLRF